MSFDPFGDDPASYVRYYVVPTIVQDCHNNVKDEEGRPIDGVTLDPIQEPYYKGILPTENRIDSVGNGKCYNQGTLESWRERGKNSDPESRIPFRLDQDINMRDIVQRHLNLVAALKRMNDEFQSNAEEMPHYWEYWDYNDGRGVLKDLMIVVANSESEYTRREALRYLKELVQLDSYIFACELIDIFFSDELVNEREKNSRDLAKTVLFELVPLIVIDELREDPEFLEKIKRADL